MQHVCVASGLSTNMRRRPHESIRSLVNVCTHPLHALRLVSRLRGPHPTVGQGPAQDVRALRRHHLHAPTFLLAVIRMETAGDRQRGLRVAGEGDARRPARLQRRLRGHAVRGPFAVRVRLSDSERLAGHLASVSRAIFAARERVNPVWPGNGPAADCVAMPPPRHVDNRPQPKTGRWRGPTRRSATPHGVATRHGVGCARADVLARRGERRRTYVYTPSLPPTPKPPPGPRPRLLGVFNQGKRALAASTAFSLSRNLQVKWYFSLRDPRGPASASASTAARALTGQVFYPVPRAPRCSILTTLCSLMNLGLAKGTCDQRRLELACCWP